MRSLFASVTLLASVNVVACGSDAIEPADSSGVNVDADGIYRFGDEEWIPAANGDMPYGATDLWTNANGESLHVRPLATLTGGETSESFSRGEFALETDTSLVTVVFPPEPIHGVPGWWWYATRLGQQPTVFYDAMFVETPRAFDTQVYAEDDDIGRMRAATILSTLRFE